MLFQPLWVTEACYSIQLSVPAQMYRFDPNLPWSQNIHKAIFHGGLAWLVWNNECVCYYFLEAIPFSVIKNKIVTVNKYATQACFQGFQVWKYFVWMEPFICWILLEYNFAINMHSHLKSFHIIPPHWNGTGSWNPTSLKTILPLLVLHSQHHSHWCLDNIWTSENKLQKNLNQSARCFFFQEDSLQNVVCKMLAILFRSQCCNC